MKTIREPLGLPEPALYHLPCGNKECRAILEVTADEMETRAVSYKQEVYKILHCPHCAYATHFETKDLHYYEVPT